MILFDLIEENKLHITKNEMSEKTKEKDNIANETKLINNVKQKNNNKSFEE